MLEEIVGYMLRRLGIRLGNSEFRSLEEGELRCSRGDSVWVHC